MPKFRDIASRVAETTKVDTKAARVALQIAINQLPARPAIDKMNIPSKMAHQLETNAVELIRAGKIPDYIAAIEQHTTALDKAELAMAAARAKRDESIRDAHKAGHPIKDIQAAAGGLTRAMVHHIAGM